MIFLCVSQFLTLIHIAYCLIPVWNFNNQSINLLSSGSTYNYTIYESTCEGTTVKLIKEINKINNNIIDKNYLTVNNVDTQEVEFEDIDSFYVDKIGCALLICPKGKFHPYNFYNHSYISPREFDENENENWELKCYNHSSGFFLIFYLMKSGYSLYFSKDNTQISKSVLFWESIYDFKLENTNTEDMNNKYKFVNIINNDEYIYLGSNNLDIDNQINLESISSINLLVKKKNNSKAYFDESNYIYFFSYNKISDFTSGHSETFFDLDYYKDRDYVFSFSFIINEQSPFQFFDDVEILDLNTLNKNYLYYKLYNKEKDKIYHGILDIKINKILYNFDEDIITFIPYSTNEMLAITPTSAYKICIIKNGNDCIQSFSSENLILDIEGNKCQSGCDNGKIKLMPEEICIDICDLNIFVLNNNEDICGLCSYFYPNGEKYKLINSSGCLSAIPNNAELFKEEFQLLKCKANYHSENNQCISDICYSTCRKCEAFSSDINNQKCLSCISGYSLNNSNCEICENICETYLDNTCSCKSCPTNYFLENNKCEIISDTLEVNEDFYFFGHYKGINESLLILRTINLTNIDNIILNELRLKMINGFIDIPNIDIGNYFYLQGQRTKFIIATTENKEINISTTIDLGSCEDKLKSNITSSNNNIYILYIEMIEENMKVPIIGYEIYYQNNRGELENMDLNVCKDIKINKSVSVNITGENLDKYNSSSGYYNDICYTCTSDNGTDITLSDRRDEYINNNMAICEDSCDFIDYNSNTGKAICSCPILVTISQISNFKLDKERLKSNFIDINNIANIEILKCYRLLFSRKIKKNIGFFIIISIFTFGIISIFIFYLYAYDLLKKKIKEIIDSIFIEKNKETLNTKKERVLKKDIKKYSNTEVKIKKKKKGKKSSVKFKNNDVQAPPKKKDEKKKKSKNKNITEGVTINSKVKFDQQSFNKTENFLKPSTSKKLKINEEKNEEKNDILKYNDSELNLLSYQEALKSDKRKYFEYYISLIRTRHLLIFSFFNNSDYNSRIIKINLFFFTFAVNFTINALFFNDSTMHKIYEDGGQFDFIYQLPQILYSTLISSFLIILVKQLALSEKNVLRIKNSESNNISKKLISESKAINCKFIAFFIIVLILLLFFGYYVGCFCAVYKNTQIQLIADTLLSFSISLLYPLILYFIPGLFRIPSLKNSNECKYRISKIIQLIV